MPFRIRQRLHITGSSSPDTFLRVDMDQNGLSRLVEYSSVMDFPSPAMFDLKNLINAKVNLEQVNSKILDTSGKVPILEPIKKDSTTTEPTTTEPTTTTKE